MTYWSTNFLLLTPPRFQTFDLSGVTYLNYGDIMNIRNSWNLFESVQVCNIRVSTSLGLGTASFVSPLSENNGLFYQFQSNAALISFRAGQQYHVTRYPYIDFSTLVQIPAPPGPGPTDLLDSCLCNAIGSVPDSSSGHLGGIAALTNYVFNSTMMAVNPTSKRYFRSYQDYITNLKACITLPQPVLSTIIVPPPPILSTIITTDLVLHFEANQTSSWTGSGSIWKNIGTGGPMYNAVLAGGDPPLYISTPIKSFQFEYNQLNDDDEYTLYNFIACKRPPTIGDDFTFCAWIKTTNVGYGFNHYNLMQIVSTETGGVNNDFGFGVDAAGYLAFGNGRLAGNDITVSSPNPVNTGNWCFVAVTRKKSNGQVVLYINGLPVLQTVCNIGNTLDVAGYILFGTEADYPGFTFGGSIAAILGNTSVLTPAQVLLNYNAQKNNYLGVTPYSSSIVGSGRSMYSTIDGPADVYPAISLYEAFGVKGQMIIMDTPYYDVPAGFTFLSGWNWSLYDPDKFTISRTNRTGDTITAKTGCNNIAVGDRIIRYLNDKAMFSVKHTTWCTEPGFDAVGVASSSVTYLGNNKYLGGPDAQSSGWFDNGTFWNNDTASAGFYTPFQKNTQIIDVLVDYVNDQLWYRVSGGPWQG